MIYVVVNSKILLSTYKVQNTVFFFQCTTMNSELDYYENFEELHGVLMYKDFVKYWDDVETFQARPDDLVIATYPKSGKSLCYSFFT